MNLPPITAPAHGSAYLHVVAGGGEVRGKADITVDDNGAWSVTVSGSDGMPVYLDFGGVETSAAAFLSSLMGAAAAHPVAVR